MRPNGGGEPNGTLAEAIHHAFGSFSEFQQKFTQMAIGQFGSGWAWLVCNPQGDLEILSTPNADNPMTSDNKPLLTCDVWEHAYYIDTRNDRPKYVSNFWQLVNWDFVERNFDASP